MNILLSGFKDVIASCHNVTAKQARPYHPLTVNHYLGIRSDYHRIIGSWVFPHINETAITSNIITVGSFAVNPCLLSGTVIQQQAVGTASKKIGFPSPNLFDGHAGTPGDINRPIVPIRGTNHSGGRAILKRRAVIFTIINYVLGIVTGTTTVNHRPHHTIPLINISIGVRPRNRINL